MMNEFQEGVVPATFFFSGLVLVSSIQRETMLKHNTLIQLPEAVTDF